MAQLTVYAQHKRQDAGRRRMAEVYMRVARIVLQWGSNALSKCEYALSKQAGDRLGRLPGQLPSRRKRAQSSARHNCRSQMPSGGLGASGCRAPCAMVVVAKNHQVVAVQAGAKLRAPQLSQTNAIRTSRRKRAQSSGSEYMSTYPLSKVNSMQRRVRVEQTVRTRRLISAARLCW